MYKYFAIFFYCLLLCTTSHIKAQSGTICKTYDDISKAEACSGQTIFVENQVNLQQPAECATESIVNATVTTKLEESLHPLEQQILALINTTKNFQLKTTLLESEKSCNANPCQNGGTCSNGSNFYIWNCNPISGQRNFGPLPVPITDLGCYQSLNAIPSLEGTTSSLKGDYHNRTNAIQKCAQAAYVAGYDVIGISDGGKCLSNFTTTQYKDTSTPVQCLRENLGSATITHIFELNAVYIAETNNLGCWKDNVIRAIPPLGNTTASLFGKHWIKNNTFIKCAKVVADLGYDVFSMQNGVWCASSAKARETYRKYGTATSCKNNGKGGPFGNQVYELKELVKISLMNMGCWADNSSHLIPTIDGLGSSNLSVENYLQGNENFDNTQVEMCARASYARGYNYFAMQSSKCMSSRNAGQIYKTLGTSSNCNSNGNGATLANQVYEINVLYKKTFV